MRDLACRRALHAVAITGLSCSHRDWNALSDLASAGICLAGLVGEGFIGTVTFILSSHSLNCGCELSVFMSRPAALSVCSMSAFSAYTVLPMFTVSSSSSGSMYHRRLLFITLNSRSGICANITMKAL